jgi:hypothetical protein
MAKFSEDTLKNWTRPPSDSEETKLSNAERMVREAVIEDSNLSEKGFEVFGQGSYANNTNVRLNSDIDINIRYTDGFYFDLPDGSTREDFSLNSPSEYSLKEFKDNVYSALISKFGDDSIIRKDKCITVVGNSYRVETDVVPTWNYRRYSSNHKYVLGAKLMVDSGGSIVNYPKQHIENGKGKNEDTSRRFKRLARIYRNLRYKMLEDGVAVNTSITSFLLECLVWNVPNRIFNNAETWQERMKESIIHLYAYTSEKDRSKEWGEVSELLYLFHSGRKWTREDVVKYLDQAWEYLEYEND